MKCGVLPMSYSLVNCHQFRMGTEIPVLDTNGNNSNDAGSVMILYVWTLKESLPTNLIFLAPELTVHLIS